MLPQSAEETELLREGKRQQIPVIAMRPLFERDAARSQQIPIGFANTVPWSGHPNSRAHALISLALYNYLAPRIAGREGRDEVGFRPKFGQ